MEPGVTPWTDPQPPITLGGPAPAGSRPVSSPPNPPLRQPQRGSTSPSGPYPSCLPQALTPVPTLPGSHGKLMPSQRRGPPGMFPCHQAQPCDPSANELRGDLPGGSGKACPPWLPFFLPSLKAMARGCDSRSSSSDLGAMRQYARRQHAHAQWKTERGRKEERYLMTPPSPRRRAIRYLC